jgi:tetratricopeptide (TPR) repeat protein
MDDPSRSHLVTGLKDVGAAYALLGRAEEADAYFAQVEQHLREGDIGEDYAAARLLQELGIHARRRGGDSLARAAEYFARALEILEKHRAPNHPDIGVVCLELGVTWRRLGDNDRALGFLQRSLDIGIGTYGADNVLISPNYDIVGVVAMAAGDIDRARTNLEKAHELRSRDLPPDHPFLGQTSFNLAEVRERDGRHKEAVELYSQALSILSNAFPPRHPLLATMRGRIARQHLSLGDPAAGLPFALDALAERLAVDPPHADNVVGIRRLLAELHTALGDEAAALAVQRENVESLLQRPEPALGSLADDLPVLGACVEAMLAAEGGAGALELLRRIMEAAPTGDAAAFVSRAATAVAADDPDEGVRAAATAIAARASAYSTAESPLPSTGS